MDEMPRVSVIVGVLNAERFLAETIESVFAQTLRSWELLLVDDGSSDGSTALARGYADQHPQAVRYFEHYGHRRRGQCASRNLAIRNARGEFIAPLDHDDVWLPNKLERQVNLLDSHPAAAMVYGATEYWRSWAAGATDGEPNYLQMPGVPANRIYQPPTLLKLMLSEQIVAPIPTDFIFRKDIICRLGGFEESFVGYLSLTEDQAFLTKVFADLPVYVSDECWDRYRIHPDQHCARVIKSGRKPDSERFFLSWVPEYLASQGAMDSEISEILNRRMWPHRHPLLNRLKQVGPKVGTRLKRLGAGSGHRRTQGKH